MITIGVDRVGVPRERHPHDGPGCPRDRGPTDRCPDDGERGVFRSMALVCPRCGRLLGGI